MFLHANPPSIKNPYLYNIEPPEYHSRLKTKLVWTVRKIQEWQNQVWGIFHDMYISELRKRRESHEIQTNALLKKGQIVLYKPQGVFRKLTPQGRLKWRLARVKKLHPSPLDGRVRSVDIELYNLKSGCLYTLTSQTIQNLAPLEIKLMEAEKRTNKTRNALRRSKRIAEKNAQN
jgi:hypothetical protein